MRHFVAVFFITFFLLGCALDSRVPTNESGSYSTPHDSSQEAVFQKAKRALMKEGFQVEVANGSAGFLATAPKSMKLRPHQATCGKIWAINYLSDYRTTTDVVINITVDAATLTISSHINGEYRVGKMDEVQPLACVSRG